MSNFSAISWQEQVARVNDDVCFVLDQHSYLNFYRAGTLKQPPLDKLSRFQANQSIAITA